MRLAVSPTSVPRQEKETAAYDPIFPLPDTHTHKYIYMCVCVYVTCL
jgi:hypothetical protein